MGDFQRSVQSLQHKFCIEAVCCSESLVSEAPQEIWPSHTDPWHGPELAYPRVFGQLR